MILMWSLLFINTTFKYNIQINKTKMKHEHFTENIRNQSF